MLNRQLVQVGRLLAGIIHEIRGPLAVIRGSAELLRLSLNPEDGNLQWVDSILRGTHLLQVRLEHLMSTVRAGPPQFEVVDLACIAQRIVELFVKGLPPSGRCISVQAEIETAPPPVRADAGRIMQVLIDLLTNAHQAIATTRQQGHIELRAEPVDQGGCGWVKVDVCDDGPGHSRNLSRPDLRAILSPPSKEEQATGFTSPRRSSKSKEAG